MTPSHNEAPTRELVATARRGDSTAQVTLDVELDLRSAGAAAVCFKHLSAGEFMRGQRELAELLDVAAHESGSQVEHHTDELGFEWVVIRDRTSKTS